MIQLIIGITGALAILLSQQKKYPNLVKYGPVLGLISQPFWFYATYKAEQWGMFALCFVYMYAWVIGLLNNWNFNFIEKLKYYINPKFGFFELSLRNGETELVLFKNCRVNKDVKTIYNREVFIQRKGEKDWKLDYNLHSVMTLNKIWTFRQLINFVRKAKKCNKSDFINHTITVKNIYKEIEIKELLKV